jgi:chromate reductase
MSDQIGMIVGSLRKNAWTRKIANKLIELTPAGFTAKIIEINELSFYNEDDETDNPPAAWTAFRQQIKPLAGVVFVTPEYNRSTTGVLKNAIDVGSRPYGKSAWLNKPCAIVSSSVGAIGGFGANHHLRQCLVTLAAPCMPSETYLSNVQQMFDENGNIMNTKTEDFLRAFMKSFGEWVAKQNTK